MTRSDFFDSWARLLAARYRWVLALAAAATLVAGFGMSRLTILGGRVDLLGDKNPVAQAWLDFGKTFGSPNNVVLLIEGGTEQQRRDAVDDIVAELSPREDLFRNILYKVDADYQIEYGVYYIEKEPIEYADKLLTGFAGEGQTATWPDVFEALEGQATSRLRTGLDDPRNIAALDGLAALMEGWANIMETGESPEPESLMPVATPLAFDNRLSPVDRQGYLVSNDGLRHILILDPLSVREDSAEFLIPFMNTIFDAINHATAQEPGIDVRFTGLSAYAYSDIQVIQKEIPWLTIAALVILVLLFLLTFGSLRPALYAGVCMLLAMIWCLGLTVVTIGHLTLLSSTVGLILLGLGIDYGIHLVVRYQEERVNRTPADALAAAYTHGASGIVTGGLTTVAAFVLCGFANFAAFAELGIIAAIGIGCNLLAMLTVLPALFMRREALDATTAKANTFGAHRENVRMDRFFGGVGGWFGRRTWLVVGLSGVVAVFAVPRALHVPFDYTFLAMQPRDSPYPEAERILQDTTNFAPHFDISLVEDDEEAAAIAERMEALPSVSHAMYAQQVLPKADPERDAAIAKFRHTAATVRLPGAPTMDELNAVEDKLNRLRVRLNAIGRSSYAIADKEPLIRVQKVARSIQRLLAASAKLDPEVRLDRHTRFLAGVADAWLAIAQRIESFSPRPPTMNDVPIEMRRRFLGDGGREAVYIVPKKSLWDIDALLFFNNDVRSVDPHFTGVGALLEEMYEAARSSTPKVGKWIGLVIVLVLLVDFRDLRPVLAISLAVALGLSFTLAIMTLLDLKFTPLNLLAVPLLMGIGVDAGVHVLHRMRAEPDVPFTALFSSTGKAVSLAALTSLVSFGLLGLSRHRGLSSFGIVIFIGVVMCYLTSMITLPCAWRFLRMRQRGQASLPSETAQAEAAD